MIGVSILKYLKHFKALSGIGGAFFLPFFVFVSIMILFFHNEYKKV